MHKVNFYNSIPHHPGNPYSLTFLGLTVTLGLGTVHAIASGSACVLVLAACITVSSAMLE